MTSHLTRAVAREQIADRLAWAERERLVRRARQTGGEPSGTAPGSRPGPQSGGGLLQGLWFRLAVTR